MPKMFLRRLLRPFWYRFRIRQALASSSPPILVYQMGKVGSSTITALLRRSPQPHVFHVHRLNPEHIERLRAERRAKGQPIPERDDVGLLLYRHFILAGCRARVITLVREPIGRNISSYFQNLDHLWRTRHAYQRLSLDRLVQGFFELFPHSTPLTWFDDEFKPILGIDVYAYEFPHGRGWLTIRTERYDTLILKSDLDDEAKAVCISNFIGIPPVPLVKRNASNEKPFGEVYREFVRSIRLPASYVDQMLNSRYARHFFSLSEIQDLRQKWLNNG